MEPQQQHVALAADASSVGPDLGALYLEHREVMFRVAHSMLRTDRHNGAEDVIGEVMVSLMKRPPPGHVDNWEAFLVRAVRNKVVDLWRSAAHRHEQLSLAEVSPLDDELGGDQIGDDPATEVIDLIERQRTVQTVREAMVELEARDSQAAFVLWQVTGLDRTSREVADGLGVSSSRVRQIAAKARKELTSILDAKGVDL